MIGENNLILVAVVAGRVLDRRRLEFFVKFIEDDIIHDKLKQE
jgi:hypothetical protein